MTYTEKELDQFLHGISLSLLSKKSAQHWRYDEETAKEIEWLEALERKVRADKADRKTEPSNSEKPNNSTISKMEQVDEPQTDWHYDEQDATWYPYKHKDEPQQESCATCKHALGNWDGESNNCGRCCGADRRFYEPKDEQTERSE